MKINFLPNESIILQEASVAHGGIMSAYTDDLYLTNLNIYCVDKGLFGNTKNIYRYPLNQIKKYNGVPQVIMGRLSNGTRVLEIFSQSGPETFYFQYRNKATITQWIKKITSIITGDDNPHIQSNNKEDTIFADVKEQFDDVGQQFRDAFGDQLKEVGTEVLGMFGLSYNKSEEKETPASTNDAPIKEKIGTPVTKKCISCSAPLTGKVGDIIRCKYCDTKQTL